MKKVMLGLVGIGFLTLGVTVVLGQVSNLPRVTTACETKFGGVLMGIDDGFSSLKTCPGNSRKVILGESNTTGGGGLPTAANVLFLGGSTLMNDGTVWYYLDGSGWVLDNDRTLPATVSPTDVIQWGDDYFMTKSGEIYRHVYGQPWQNIGAPNL
jgi:hypothetical protein